MTICAVFDLKSNSIINIIMAEPSDLPPEGCQLVKIPPNCYLEGNQIITLSEENLNVE